MGKPRRASVASLLTGLEARFRRHRASGVEAVVLFEVSGEGGGEWTLTVAQENCSVAPGAARAPDAVVRVSAEDLLRVCPSGFNPREAFESGRLSVRGRLGLFLRLEPLFAP